jgi:DNA-binding MarR family transcriptional regulator
MLERLHDHGFADLEPAHLIVLQYPGPQGTRPSELAARLRISKQALNYLLGQLEGLGYLERPGRLGRKRFDQLRTLLQDLNELD